MSFHSIRTRVMGLVLALALVPMVVTGVLLYDLSSNKLQGEIRMGLQQRLRQASDRVEEVFETVEQLAGELSLDSQLRGWLMTDAERYESSLKVFGKLKYLYSALTSPTLRQPGLDSIYLYDGQHNLTYMSGAWGDRTSLALNEPEWLAGFQNDGWQVGSTLVTRSDVSAAKKVLCYRIAVNFGRVIAKPAYLYFNVAVSKLQSYFAVVPMSQSGVVILADREGNPLPGQAMGKYDEYRKALANGRAGGYMVETLDSAGYGWRYIAVQPVDDLTSGRIDDMRIRLMLIMGVLALLAIPLAYMLTSSIHRPVDELLRAMAGAETGDLNVRLASVRRDEFGRLYDGFNRMVDRIRDLIDRIYRQRIEQQSAEIKALQSQINPHFLYNTLDAIHWMARMGETDKISDLTFALSKFYRLVLSKGKDVVPMREAAELAQEYLKVQRIRYRDRLTSEFDIDPAIADMPVPKLFLQPLVENAVLHGIDAKRDAGMVRVLGRAVGGVARITVWDNGGGMPPERLEEVRAALNEGAPDTGAFALRSLYNQLSLLTGGRVKMEVDSECGQWTQITLEIRMQDEEVEPFVAGADRRG